MKFAAGIVIVVCMASFAWSQDDAKGKDAKKNLNLPLSLKLTAKTAVYELDLKGKTAEEFAAIVKKAKAGDVEPPATPKVDLLAEIKNTSQKPVRIWSEGDPVVLELKVKGPGAHNIAPPLAFTLEFRIPKEITIEPGESHIVPIDSLRNGFRGRSSFSYWTKPGEYEIQATFKTGVAPPPPGTTEQDGFGVVTLTAAPVEVRVLEKKGK